MFPYRSHSGWQTDTGRTAPDEKAQTMIDLYYWTTPNGHKITLFLEEAGLPYTIHPVNLSRGDQFKPEFLAISPNNRIPAIVDKDPSDSGAPVSVFESGAILVYLAEKTGRFLPWPAGGARMALLAGRRPWPHGWPEPSFNETNRLYGVLNKRLADRAFVARNYSIADMAAYPWIVPHENQGQRFDDFLHLKRWFEAIEARPATRRAYAIAAEINTTPIAGDEESRKILFSQTAANVK
jgi:GST-like protein